MKKDISILIGGPAGAGSRIAGNILAKIFSKFGYLVYVYEDYQSLIRGGHNFSEIRVAEKLFNARKEKIDFILALDENTIQLHKDRLTSDGMIFYVKKDFAGENFFIVDIDEILKEADGGKIMSNVALVCAFSKAVGIDWAVIEDVLRKEIRREIEMNLRVAKVSFEKTPTLFSLQRGRNPRSHILTGNEAVGTGLAMAGLQFYIGYPMTPTTSLMNFLARNKNLGVKVIQAENEIGVINMALGCAFAGARSAVGTSGGGFALMTETISLAGISETPIFIIEGQRAGPSTGMPTYNMQADLLFVLSAGHGDFPRFVLTPGNAKDCIYYSQLGLHLAWKYQVPVIFLLDKDICENSFSIKEDEVKKIEPLEIHYWGGGGEYKRYEITESGISDLTFPGKRGAVVKASSYEHDEYGITTEDPEICAKMQMKRYRKYEEMRKEVEQLPSVFVFGNKDAKTVLVTFGISTGPVMEVVEKLNIRMVQPIIMEPFPKKKFLEAIGDAANIITVEMNVSGQLARVLSQNGIFVNGKILKYNGRPFYPKEIEEELIKNYGIK